MPIVPRTRRADGTRSRTLVGGYTAIVAAVVALILHYTGAAPLPVEALTASWTTAVLAALAVVLRFRTEQPVETKRQHRSRSLLLGVFCFVLAGCASTLQPIQRDGIERLSRAGIETAVGVLEIQQLPDAAAMLEGAEDGLVKTVRGSLEYPTDTRALARGIVEATHSVLVDLGQDTAARLVAVAEPIIRWAIEQALGAFRDDSAPSASGSSG